MKESNVLRAAWLALAGVRATVFRVNTGKGWVSGGGEVQRLADGSVRIPFARPVALGFGDVKGDPIVGTSDLIGWTEIVVTPEMVGHKVAIFTAIETKESGGGRKREGQKTFLARLISAGGIGGFAASADAARMIVQDFCNRFAIK